MENKTIAPKHHQKGGEMINFLNSLLPVLIALVTVSCNNESNTLINEVSTKCTDVQNIKEIIEPNFNNLINIFPGRIPNSLTSVNYDTKEVYDIFWKGDELDIKRREVNGTKVDRDFVEKIKFSIDFLQKTNSISLHKEDSSVVLFTAFADSTYSEIVKADSTYNDPMLGIYRQNCKTDNNCPYLIGFLYNKSQSEAKNYRLLYSTQNTCDEEMKSFRSFQFVASEVWWLDDSGRVPE